MVSLFFGLPGSGKSTILASLAYKFTKKRSPYKNVYSNLKLKIKGVTYIDNDCIGRYLLEDCAILIDEATLFADSRAYKNFDNQRLAFFLEHRHFHADIYLFTQQWDGVDRKIRVITDRVYYVYKTFPFGFWISNYYQVPYGIIIPDPKKSQQSLGEIIQGYCKPSLLSMIFCHKVFRPRYYKFFDSFEKYSLPPLPDRYQKYGYEKDTIIVQPSRSADSDADGSVDFDQIYQ